jgi:hypothetical protein
MNQRHDTDYRLVYTNPDTGILCIIIPTGEVPIEQVAKGSVPSEVEYWEVHKNDIPEDRSFRDAWELDKSIVGEPNGIGEGN